MPFSGNTYTGPAGSTSAVAGQVIQSAVWDNINTDVATALTALMTQINTNMPGWQNYLAPNASFNVWQRGTTFSVGAGSTAYTADRWYLTTGANEASVVAAIADLEVGSAPTHAVKITRTVAETGTTVMTFGYPLDSDEIYRMRGKMLSFSCSVKTGANWSPASGTLTVRAAFGTNPPAKRGAGFTGESSPLLINTNLAVSSALTTISGTSSSIVPVSSTQGELQFTWLPTGTAGADDSISIDDVCLCPGTIVQNYAEIPFEVCLGMCKRYYTKTFSYATAPAAGSTYVGALESMTRAAGTIYIYWNMETELRGVPAVTTYNPAGAASSAWIDFTGGISVTTTYDATTAGPKGMFIYTAVTVAAFHTCMIHAAADASI